MNVACLSLSWCPTPELRSCSLELYGIWQAKGPSRLEEHTSCQLFYFQEGGLTLSCSQGAKSRVGFTLSSLQKCSRRPRRLLLLVELPLARQTPFLWSLHLGPGSCSDPCAREGFSCIPAPGGTTEGFAGWASREL